MLSGLQDSSSTQPCGLTDQSIQCLGVHVLRGPLVIIIIIHLSAADFFITGRWLAVIMSVCSSSKVDVNLLRNCQHRKKMLAFISSLPQL